MSEVPLFPLWVTIFLTIWAAGGTLVGILVGHYLLRSWQREQWVLDNKKQEYREVLSQLTLVFSLVAEASGRKTPLSLAEIDRFTEAHRDSLRVLHDRIFIADKMKKHKLQVRWLTAFNEFSSTHDKGAFSRAFGEISDVALQCAREDMKLGSLHDNVGVIGSQKENPRG